MCLGRIVIGGQIQQEIISWIGKAAADIQEPRSLETYNQQITGSSAQTFFPPLHTDVSAGNPPKV